MSLRANGPRNARWHVLIERATLHTLILVTYIILVHIVILDIIISNAYIQP